jgi:hypothetical protein
VVVAKAAQFVSRQRSAERVQPPACYTASMLRRPRIVASVFFAGLALVLCLLWARSNHHRDVMRLPFLPPRHAFVDSNKGNVTAFVGSLNGWRPPGKPSSIFAPDRGWPQPVSGFAIQTVSPSGVFVTLPHWLLFAVCLTLAAVPSVYKVRQFSLRTMLIATTVVALILGAVVILSR